MASFRAKVSKYGDRLLETIESTIKEFYKTQKNTSSSNDSNDSGKRRRDENKAPNTNKRDDDDYAKSTARSKKRASNCQNKTAEVVNYKESDSYNECMDDLDFDEYGYVYEMNGSTTKPDRNNGGRVLPPWSMFSENR